ncbi:MAG: hypothetical protein GQ574_00505 [Crocinitomix sp.]|nr:hypothetical protein [Crocinitomix sp.]
MVVLGWIVFVTGILSFVIGGFASFVARVNDKEQDETERALGIDILRHKKSLLMVICGLLAFLLGRAILLSEGIETIAF